MISYTKEEDNDMINEAQCHFKTCQGCYFCGIYSDIIHSIESKRKEG